MTTKGYPTTATPVNRDKYGDVTARVAKTLIVEVNLMDPIGMDEDVTEVHLMVNGRKISTMHPERARHLGLVHYWS